MRQTTECFSQIICPETYFITDYPPEILSSQNPVHVMYFQWFCQELLICTCSGNSVFFPLGCLYYIKTLQKWSWLVPTVLSVSFGTLRSTHQELLWGTLHLEDEKLPDTVSHLKVPSCVKKKTCYCHWGVNLNTCKSQYYKLMKLLITFFFSKRIWNDTSPLYNISLTWNIQFVQAFHGTCLWKEWPTQ